MGTITEAPACKTATIDGNNNKSKQDKDITTECMKWFENHASPVVDFLERMPEWISSYIAVLAVFTLAFTLRGEWIIVLIAAAKQYNGFTQEHSNFTAKDLLTLENMKLNNFFPILVMCQLVSFGCYFGIGSFLHWYYYVKRRHEAKDWKIQPDKWITPELEKHEIKTGTIALLFVGTFSAFLATYIYNGNPCTVYFQFDEYGWFWFFAQVPVIFLYQDYTTYILHRLYHTPFLYKNFHKLHHTYKQPTAFSVTAIHPFEIMHIQLTSCLLLFTIPIHWLPFYLVAIYNYVHGIIDHSGINFKSQWWQPWQPDAEFHDQHHEFFHCNFGFNMDFWDKLHGTMRKTDQVYTEETFHDGVSPAGSGEKKIQ